MKHNLIKTDNYLLVVNDSEIKEGDFIYDLDIKRIVKADSPKVATSKKSQCWYYKKIISHLPLNGAPVLEGVPLLPRLPKEDDVEKLAEQYVSANYPHYLNEKEKAAAIEDVCWGYNKAKEKYKYTEEDLRKAIEMAQECSICECFLGPHIEREHTEKSIIQSLQHHPKYPIAVECEMRTKQMPEFHEDLPKIITNSEGRTEWVGKYIYE